MTIKDSLCVIAIVFTVNFASILPSFAGGGENAIQFPELQNDQQKVEFLLALKAQIPALFSQAATYDIDLLNLLDDETRLHEQLMRIPHYQELFKKRKFVEISIVPSKEGIPVGVKKIKDEAVVQWKEDLKRLLLKAKATHKDPSQLRNDLIKELSQVDDLDSLSKEGKRLLGELLKHSLPEAKKSNQDVFNHIAVLKDKSASTADKLDGLIHAFKEFGLQESKKNELQASLVRTRDSLHKQDTAIKNAALLTFFSDLKGGLPESWDQAAIELDKLSVDQLIHFEDKEDALSPRIKEILSNLPQKVSTDLVDSVYKMRIEPYSSQVSSTMTRATAPVVLTEVPPALGIFRGCTGGDCSSQYSFPYPNDPSERVFFVKDADGKLKGYVSTTEVIANPPGGAKGKSLYAITTSGGHVSAGDTELILRGLDQSKEKLGVDEVLVPAAHSIPGLINFPEIAGVYTAHAAGKQKAITYQNPSIRGAIEKYQSHWGYNSGGYDHQDYNTHAVTFRPKSVGKVQVGLKELEMIPIHPIALQRKNMGQVIEFLIDLKRSNRGLLYSRVMSVLKSKNLVTQADLDDFMKHLETCSSTVDQRDQILKASLKKLGMLETYLETHPDLEYPGITHCQDSFEKTNIDRVATHILKRMKSHKLDSDWHLNQIIGTHREKLNELINVKNFLTAATKDIKSETLEKRNAAASMWNAFQPKDPNLLNELMNMVESNDREARNVSARILLSRSDLPTHVNDRLSSFLKPRIQDILKLKSTSADKAAVEQAIARLDELKEFMTLDQLYKSPELGDPIEFLLTGVQHRSFGDRFKDLLDKSVRENSEFRKKLLDLLTQRDLVNGRYIVKLLEKQNGNVSYSVQEREKIEDFYFRSLKAAMKPDANRETIEFGKEVLRNFQKPLEEVIQRKNSKDPVKMYGNLLRNKDLQGSLPNNEKVSRPEFQRTVAELMSGSDLTTSHKAFEILDRSSNLVPDVKGKLLNPYIDIIKDPSALRVRFNGKTRAELYFEKLVELMSFEQILQSKELPHPAQSFAELLKIPDIGNTIKDYLIKNPTENLEFQKALANLLADKNEKTAANAGMVLERYKNLHPPVKEDLAQHQKKQNQHYDSSIKILQEAGKPGASDEEKDKGLFALLSLKQNPPTDLRIDGVVVKLLKISSLEWVAQELLITMNQLRPLEPQAEAKLFREMLKHPKEYEFRPLSKIHPVGLPALRVVVEYLQSNDPRVSEFASGFLSKNGISRNIQTEGYFDLLIDIIEKDCNSKDSKYPSSSANDAIRLLNWLDLGVSQSTMRLLKLNRTCKKERLSNHFGLEQTLKGKNVHSDDRRPLTPEEKKKVETFLNDENPEVRKNMLDFLEYFGLTKSFSETLSKKFSGGSTQPCPGKLSEILDESELNEFRKILEIVEKK